MWLLMERNARQPSVGLCSNVLSSQVPVRAADSPERNKYSAHCKGRWWLWTFYIQAEHNSTKKEIYTWKWVLGVLQTAGMQARICHQHVAGCTAVFCTFSRVTIRYCGTVWSAAIKHDGFCSDPLLEENKCAADLDTNVNVGWRTNLSLEL